MLRSQNQESKYGKNQQKKDAQYILKSTHVYSKPHDTVLNYMNMQLFFFLKDPYHSYYKSV